MKILRKRFDFLRNSLVFAYVRLATLILIPVVLLGLPANFFDAGQSLCLSVLLFQQECFACGITRAIMHLLHLEFEEAFAYNMMSFIVLPALIVLWGVYLKTAIRRVKSLKQSH